MPSSRRASPVRKRRHGGNRAAQQDVEVPQAGGQHQARGDRRIGNEDRAEQEADNEPSGNRHDRDRNNHQHGEPEAQAAQQPHEGRTVAGGVIAGQPRTGRLTQNADDLRLRDHQAAGHGETAQRRVAQPALIQ